MQFRFKTLPFPVNLGSTRTYDSGIGGNASTGLGSTDHHSSQDMREFEADDRPTDETNRKSLHKNPHNGPQPRGTKVSHRKPNTEVDIRSRRRDAEEELTEDRRFGRSTEDTRSIEFAEDARCGTSQRSTRSRSQPKSTKEDTRDIRFAEATRSTEDTEEDVARINTWCRTLHGEHFSAELGRSLGEATREYRRNEDRRTEERRSEDVPERRMGVGVGERRFEDGAEVTRVTEEFRYTEDTHCRMSWSQGDQKLFRKPKKPKTFGSPRSISKTTPRSNVMQKQRWSTWMDSVVKCPAHLKFARKIEEKMPKEGLRPE